jgi:hypothetical protein
MLGAAMQIVGHIRSLFLVTALTLPLASTASRADILYRFNQGTLFDGGFGPIAKVQAKVSAALSRCGKPGLPSPDGKFGPGLRTALVTLATCPEFSAAVAADNDARAGALTQTFWTALMGEPAPSVDDRARTLMLTYEATDYTRMEWNYCQSRPLYNPPAGNTVCYSNDPRSYLTWGPNGATGGGGRDVQLILQAVDAASPALVDQSFGSEANAVRRMFKMPNGDPSRSLETYLCGIWIDGSRRAAWKSGFQAIGKEPSVRTTFDKFYKSASLDGGKIAGFIDAYAAYGLTPTEIDYAFFKDRAAHMSLTPRPIRQAIETVPPAERTSARWKVRRAIALNVRPGAQVEDRLGRDVAFYLDGAGNALSREESSAWQARGRLRASDAGLSDSRNAPAFRPEPAIDTRINSPASLTDAERTACPAAVLATQRPPRRR